MLKTILTLYIIAFLAPPDSLPSSAEAELALPELPLEAPRLEPVADNLLHADKNLPQALQYQAQTDLPVIHYDAQGNGVDAAVAGGFYRKFLGKTAEGQHVVQDFYQDNDQPQTGPSLLKKDADPKDFSVEMVDSKTVWYREDGSISDIADIKDGIYLNYNHHYRNGLLVMKSQHSSGAELDTLPGWGDIYRAYFYPDGRYLAVFVEGLNGESYFAYFRADGSPILAGLTEFFTADTPPEGSYFAWKADGSTATLEDVRSESDAVMETLSAIEQP